MLPAALRTEGVLGARLRYCVELPPPPDTVTSTVIVNCIWASPSR